MPLPDSVIVQWHPTADWNAELNDADWQTINLKITRLWYRRGYKRGHQRVEAGEFSCTFLDPDRVMDPLRTAAPNYRKGRRQFRVRVTIGASTFTVFRGITSGWQPEWRMRDFRVTMRGTDRSPALEAIWVPSVFEQTVRALNPLWWFRMGESARPDALVTGQYLLANFGSDNRQALSTGMDVKGQSVLPYDERPSVVGSETAPAGSFAQLNPSIPSALTKLSGTSWTLCSAFVTEGPGALYAQGPSGGPTDIVLGVSWDPPTNRVSIYAADATNPAVFLHSDQVVTDNAPHIAIATYAGTVLKLKVDMASLKVGPLLSSAPSPRSGSSLIGSMLDGTQPFGKGRIGHLIAWDYALNDGFLNDVNKAALLPWDGLRTDQVIAKILDYVGIAAGERNLEVGQEVMGPSRCEASALVCCERPAATESPGLFFFDREGKATFYARNHSVPLGTTRDTAPPAGLGRIKLQDLRVDMDERTFYTVGKAYVAAADPLEVAYRHANADVDGELVWAPETEFRTEALALAGAQRMVGDGQAKPHFTHATTIGETLNFAEILTRDVWDHVGIIGRPGGVEVYQESRILEVEHEMDGVALTWTCRLALEAAM